MINRGTASASTVPIGLLIVLVAAWAGVVPLVGPYFGFGFATDDTWSLSRLYWLVSFAPGVVAFVGGLIMLVPRRRSWWRLGVVLGFLGGLWLIIGPALYPVLSAGSVDVQAAAEWKTAVLWIAYFYGAGALIVFFAGLAQGIAARRPAEYVWEEAAVEPTVMRTPRARARIMSYP